jgi:hypothetical protein
MDDLRAWCLWVAEIYDKLHDILGALEDKDLDCEQTMEKVKEAALKALNHADMMRRHLAEERAVDC